MYELALVGFMCCFGILNYCVLIILFRLLYSQNDSREVLKCLQFGTATKQYCDAVRSFALTLHFYSPRGYNFLRERFKNHLPDPSTIRSWYSNCTGYGEPGLCVEALKTLSDLADKMKQGNEPKQLFVSSAFDEMSIRRHVSWNEAKNKFIGFISYGSKNENDELPVASSKHLFF